MGICSDIMHDFVLQEIKRIYSSYDGWTITPVSKGSGYDTMFSIERRIQGNIERVRVFVTFKKTVTADLLTDLAQFERSPFGVPVRQDCAVIAAAGADTSKVPSELKVFTMNSFAYDGDNLIWVKKPVRTSVDAPAKTVSAQTA